MRTIMPLTVREKARRLLQIVAASVAVIILAGCSVSPVQSQSSPTGYFTLWQLPSQSPSQMNSYVLRTGNGKIIVVDGGMKADAAYLKGFLAALGNHVNAWFISHPHADHIDALTEVLNNPGDVTVDKIYASLPSEQWFEKYEHGILKSLQPFNESVKKTGVKYFELYQGQVIEIDKVIIEILGVKNLDITSNAGNNSSIVMKVTDSKKSVLFLGDLGVEGGRKLLKSCRRDKLKADYIQMAHHGQNGVDRAFYEAVKPKYCLWPTPRWLWDNNNGGGKDSGKWDTLNVRKWMTELGVEKHYVSADGLCRIE